MKESRFRDMDAQELKTELKSMEEQMFRLRFQLSMGQTDGVKKVRELRKDRARMLTALRERELAEAKK
jgi:large subunit ribosomal protein L29